MNEIAHIPLSIDTYFDKVFYINLEEDTNRNEKMSGQFEEFGIKNYERVDAKKLAELPDSEEYRNFIKHDHKYLLGTLSCRLSHLKCIKLAKERGYEKVLIFEDDAYFLQDPNMLLNENMRVLDEWDMIYFGGLVEPFFRSQIVCAHAYAVKSTLYDDIINMAEASGMEIDNFYAKILQHMSYNYNRSGKYNIRMIQPFNQIVQDKTFESHIQTVK